MNMILNTGFSVRNTYFLFDFFISILFSELLSGLLF